MWARDKGELIAAAKVIRQYCADRLKLDLKQCIVLPPSTSPNNRNNNIGFRVVRP
jgi:hypothetical protein